ncbi:MULTISPECIES: hypothetical protein [Paraburkholderia]|uniref:hypothetical protein n=1 Tax=Paraburkholderia TaxID=1822464 RepID=UPI000A3FDB95|nr:MULTISPECIES: hypothetical protein [Paraburkholderia]MBB2983052.1 hypothetical protein [Paraburkholderia tropica]MBN3811070.1 hypothetical protein [Paraburkholderia sp. Ac-20347]MDE1144176.1 hypothetical protein [Paraburkholderia tropica]QNB15415.1 hypothetical protein G5S35_27840 [Paraburkholderia tropica]RQN36495.1 hypothetical protein EHZ25_24445 [Paraburkholderia tropica]
MSRTIVGLPLRRLLLLLLIASSTLFQGCSSTLGNIALGMGLGTVGTVSALGCALTCQGGDPGW